MGKTAYSVALRRFLGAWLILCGGCFALPGQGFAETIRVTPEDDLARVIRGSEPQDVIEFSAGRYVASDIRISHDLTLTGEGADGEVILFSSEAVAKGLLVPRKGVNLTVRSLIFEGAHSPDRNGAGIRFEGQRLSVSGSVFRDNENGILATGDANGGLMVTGSTFLRNGHGDGYSHGIYQSSGAQFHIEKSRFEETRVGHHLKTLASDIRVEGNHFEDGEGRTSYVLDVPSAGNTVFAGNKVYRRYDADQRNLVNFSTRRGDHRGQMIIRGNQITSEKRIGLLRNPERLPAELNGNRIDYAKRGQSGGRLMRMSPPGLSQMVATLSPSIIPEPEMSFRLRRLNRTGGYVTYGQVFEEGAVPIGAALLVEGSEAFPLQMDVKATHADGSVRHAVLTASIPEGRGELTGQYVAIKGEVAPLLTWDEDIFSGLTLTLEGVLGGEVTTARLDVADALAAGNDWLTGPLAYERMANVPAGPLLNIRLDGRQYRDGTARLRLSFENHKTFNPLPRELSYRVSLMRDGEVLFSKDVPDHYRHSGWTALVALGAEPAAEPVPSLARLVSSGAIPPYKDDVNVSLGSPLRAGSPVLPGVYGPITPHMPRTGGRPDIGPMTHWGAVWAISGKAQARADMLALADIGLTIPWHFEEDETGLPIRADQREMFWADVRGGGKGTDKFPKEIWTRKPGGWTPDLAHKPQLAYPAYLATGEATYARALSREAAYAISAIWPKKRQMGDLVVTHEQQIRTSAWSLRTISNAAFLLPDDDPLKEYFIGIRNDSIEFLYRRNVSGSVLDAAGETEGWLDQFTPRDGPGAMAPWQQDFLAIILAHEVIRGTPHAEEVLDWMTGFIAGRVLHMTDPRAYAAGRVTLLDGRGKPVSSWVELEHLTRENFPKQKPYYGAATGYYSTLRAALGAIETATGDEHATAALNKLRGIGEGARLFAPGNDGGRQLVTQFNLDTEN